MKKISIIWIVVIFLSLNVTPAFSKNVPVEDVAVIYSVKGDAKVVPKGRNIGIECQEGMPVFQGDWIKTSQGATVSLSFDKDAENVLTVEENSLVIIKLDGYFKIQLLTGEVYAILENVEKGETFRVLTPSVITESDSSGLGVTSDGMYTNVVVFDNKALICGINQDGTAKDDKYWITEGHQRKTIKFQDPGEMSEVPEDFVEWFKEQVVVHHLSQEIAKEKVEQGLIDPTKTRPDEEEIGETVQDDGKPKPLEKKQNVKKPRQASQNTIIVDGEEVNLLEFLYKERLKSN